MKSTLENDDKENEDSNEADSESIESSSSDYNSLKDWDTKHKKINKSNWASTTKKYKADFELSSSKVNIQDDETIMKKAVEKSPKDRFVRVLLIIKIKFDEVLGNGSFKRVYKGYDLDDAKEVAWNVINVGNMTNDEIERIKEEINLIKKLKNPRILHYISGWVNDAKKEVIFITDIFSGGSLKQYIAIIYKVIKGWCKEILYGLKYLHEQENPIIHRDIKCDNIFIDKNDGMITIGDFGYSCVLKNDYANSFSGTPEFMAPEVFQSKYGINADIYSFGMCLLEMITIEKPYKECENIYKIYTLATQGVLPKSLHRINNEKVKDFIKSCLKKENERPTANELLNSEFLKDLESEENNFPVPLLDEDCKYIINQENNNLIESTSSNQVALNRLKSQQLDDKKQNHQNFRRDSILDKNKESKGPLKNSPVILKMPTNVKFDDKSVKVDLKKHNTCVLHKSSASSNNLPNNNNNYKEFCNHDIDNYYFSSSDSDPKSTFQRNAFRNSSSQIESNKFQFLKERTKSIKTRSNIIKSELNQKEIDSSHGKMTFSKLELFLDKDAIPDFKKEFDRLVIVLKIKKQNWKNKKKIMFDYNLKIDTVEKVVNEMKNQRQLNLNDEETSIIMEKLTSFLKSLNSDNGTKPINQSMEIKKITKDEASISIEKNSFCIEDFILKYEKILNNARELINSVVNQDYNIFNCNNLEVLEKIENLQKFINDKSNKGEK